MLNKFTSIILAARCAPLRSRRKRLHAPVPLVLLVLLLLMLPVLPCTPLLSPSEAADLLHDQAARATGHVSMPVYKPRVSSAPRARIDGAFRGEANGELLLRVLAPGHVGFTVKAQPVLYWYLSGAHSMPVEFTLVDTRTIAPVLEAQLEPPAKPGLQRIKLKELGPSLESGVQYQWSISLITDPASRSRDVMARGTIERIPYDEAMTLDLVKPCNRDMIYVFAEKGVWYDAVGCVMELMEDFPDDTDLPRILFSLLDQGGLTTVLRELAIPGRHPMPFRYSGE